MREGGEEVRRREEVREGRRGVREGGEIGEKEMRERNSSRRGKKVRDIERGGVWRVIHTYLTFLDFRKGHCTQTHTTSTCQTYPVCTLEVG